jgi:hypothetical protein
VTTQAALLDALTDKLAAARSQSRRASAAGADEAEAARLRLQLAQVQGEGQALQQQLSEARAEAGGHRARPPGAFNFYRLASCSGGRRLLS